jgi:hypothetical protein
MSELVQKRDWKALAALLCWGLGKLLLLAGGFLEHVPHVLTIGAFIVILGFGLLCAVSAIRTGGSVAKIAGGLAFLLLIALLGEVFTPVISHI